MSKSIDVYGIGNAIVDLQLKVSEEQFAKLGLNKGGMDLVDQQVQLELLSAINDREINRASGGSAANTIIALAQLGAKCAYAAVVANDDFGQFYLQEMRELGVVVELEPVKEGVTGSSVILVTPDSERTMNTHLGATGGFSPEHVSEELIEKSKWVYLE